MALSRKSKTWPFSSPGLSPRALTVPTTWPRQSCRRHETNSPRATRRTFSERSEQAPARLAHEFTLYIEQNLSRRERNKLIMMRNMRQVCEFVGLPVRLLVPSFLPSFTHSLTIFIAGEARKTICAERLAQLACCRSCSSAPPPAYLLAHLFVCVSM